VCEGGNRSKKGEGATTGHSGIAEVGKGRLHFFSSVFSRAPFLGKHLQHFSFLKKHLQHFYLKGKVHKNTIGERGERGEREREKKENSESLSRDINSCLCW
jgi:hypothetical protein